MLIKKPVSITSNFESYVTCDNNFMNLDVALIKLHKEQEIELNDNSKEKAVLLLIGECQVEIINNDNQILKTYQIKRENTFQNKPSVIHVDHNHKLKIKAASKETELIYEATKNTTTFDYKVYLPNDLKVEMSGINESRGFAERRIIEIFSYQNAPYSKMVMGEVITSPGSWASWPPHRHVQPEMYLFRFNQLDGFGISVAGENAYVVNHNDAVCIPGNLLHPTVTAPNYLMYYCWMIQNFENNPWTERRYEEKFLWTKSNECEISRIEEDE